ncbi:oligosaccharide flippase family protein [Marinobacter sp. MDS2]|uniref:oligosaccharide flippase family protein n=1 Tax=Marinobacter sp. MDS2 TaxID=3065961 RepID=UPI00273AB77E|nr:oligosaccharide flippase family protein [Marinobacter sp. MDS2]MDP4546877.1 oligosaccharide flippase family protein [Marinobacter sp. MDS2]
MSLKAQLIKSFMGVGAMKLFSIPIGLATSIILARTLGPEGFGQYAFVIALIPLIALPVSGGLPQLLTREVATFAHSKSWSLYRGALRASHVWVFFVAAAILIGYWVLGVVLQLLPSDAKWSLLPIALMMVPLSGLAAVRTGTIKGLGFPAYAEIPGQLIQPVVMLVLFTVLALYGDLDAKSAIWSQVAGGAVIFLIASWMFFKIQPSDAKGVAATYQVGRWKRALLPFSMIALVSTFNAQIGIIALGFLSADEQVAAMRVAERGGQFVAMSLMLVNMVIAPYIVGAYRDGDQVLLQNLARKSARGSLFLALPVAGILIVGGDPLIRLAFGEEYATISYWPVVIIAIGQLINVFFGSVGHLLSMSGYERFTLGGQVIAVLINIVFCILLIPRFGAVGAAVSVALSIVVWNLVLAYFVLKKLNIRPAAF